MGLAEDHRVLRWQKTTFQNAPEGLVVAVLRMTRVDAHGNAFTALDFGTLVLARHYRTAGEGFRDIESVEGELQYL